MHLLNAWYVACSSDEVASGADAAPFGRRVCGHSMVFYRRSDDIVACVEDFCPHRGAPLSLGRVREGNLVCGYHGLVMGSDGHCIAMPGVRAPRLSPIRAFPVVERHGFVWVWPGDARAADAAALPALPWAGRPDWAYGGGLYHVRCDYRLMIDNLMDLTHETYVHANSIGQPEIEQAPVTTEVRGDHVVTSRFMDHVMAPPFWRTALRGNGLADDVPVDRWQICHFDAPSHVMIEVGVAHAGRGGYRADAAHKVSSVVVDFITPETDTSIWYFWGMARNFNVTDVALTDAIREGQRRIFAEDLAMLERQQQNLSAWPDRRLATLAIDAGGMQARRVIERLVAAERGTLAAA